MKEILGTVMFSHAYHGGCALSVALPLPGSTGTRKNLWLCI